MYFEGVAIDQTALRGLTSQLAEDLAWLEQHARRQPELAVRAGELRLASALVRNVLNPFLEKQPAAPLHLAVVGGAGAGKSTVANMLAGSLLAESNPQAGYTRHPIAYTSANGQISWPAHLGFLGPLERLTKESPADVDADVYQVRRVSQPPTQGNLLDDFVIWDCPDMTTWASSNYVPRLLEVAALADVIIYVASDERYNDEVPTQFLKLLLHAGKPVVVCLVKMRAEDAPALVAHFRSEILRDVQTQVVGVLTIPHLTHAQLSDPSGQAMSYRIPLINQVMVLGTPVSAGRVRSVQSSMQYLKNAQNELLGVAREDLAALDSWRGVVQEGQLEFENRYRREYLTSERFRRFDEALVRLLELLELPGLGKVVSTTLWVVRTPYRVLKSLFTSSMGRPGAPTMPERPVLEGALRGWVDLVRKEAARRAGSHPLWTHVNKAFAADLPDLMKGQFDKGLRDFQLNVADEVERTARAIYEDLERNPVALNTLRGTKFALEIASIGGVIAVGGLSLIDLILVPLAASVTHQLVELLGKQYVDNQRENARARQQALVTQFVASPVAEWLTQWPTTGGSEYERLQLALRRIPPGLQQLEAALQNTLKETPR